MPKNGNKIRFPGPCHPRRIERFAPALIQVAENDILYDEGVAYGRKLDEAGVPVTTTVYKGMIHDYGMLNPLSHIPGVQEALTQASAVLRKALFAR